MVVCRAGFISLPMMELLKTQVVNKICASLRPPFYGEKPVCAELSAGRQSQNGRDRFFAALIAMTLIFSHLLIMPQKFGVKSLNDNFGDILYCFSYKSSAGEVFVIFVCDKLLIVNCCSSIGVLFSFPIFTI